jgi:hypothetical protein
VKKLRHIILKVQNEDGLDSSYAKSVPPIGDPNAALTPAAIPAAANYRFISSFL